VGLQIQLWIRSEAELSIFNGYRKLGIIEEDYTPLWGIKLLEEFEIEMLNQKM